ncbi:MAG: hypothetical protein QGG88_04145 [Gammaproteobacteria bacterium]|jgi:hypothetical protein|nr:hypothetical protein [Gammaproteobacteria bacterium]
MILLFILSGCSTAPTQQVEAGKTLVIGRVIYTGEQIDEIYTIDMNIKAKQQIDMIVDPPGSLGNKLRTGPGGLFYYLADTNQTFTITELKLHKETDRAWRSISQQANIKGKTAADGVTNFGTIYWHISGEHGSQTRQTDQVKEIEAFFKLKYPDSPWSTETWHIK